MLGFLMVESLNNRWTSYFALFASTGTLFCCALPSLLVALGMGATMAGLVTAVPQLVWLSQYKALVFGVSGLMILIASYLQYRSRFETCPTDPKLAKACTSARIWSHWILAISGIIWVTGAFFAFAAPYVLG